VLNSQYETSRLGVGTSVDRGVTAFHEKRHSSTVAACRRAAAPEFNNQLRNVIQDLIIHNWGLLTRVETS